jgi:hypothetical protein
MAQTGIVEECIMMQLFTKVGRVKGKWWHLNPKTEKHCVHKPGVKGRYNYRKGMNPSCRGRREWTEIWRATKTANTEPT